MQIPKIRKFTEQDWYLLGGAEKFHDGHEPLIADDFEYGDIIAVVDVNGLQVLINGNEYCFTVNKNFNWDSILAKKVLRLFVRLISNLTDEEAIYLCKNIGFKPV